MPDASPPSEIKPHPDPLRKRLFTIIFGTDTRKGRIFDIILLWAIILSIFAVLLESVAGVREHFLKELLILEWLFTILFTMEYIVRLLIVKKKRTYIFSFLGIIDLLAIVPSYLNLFIPGSSHSLAVIRGMRLLRVFRILKLGRYLEELHVLIRALKSSSDKIAVFLCVVLTMSLLSGTLMYLLEGEENGFTSIPKSIYWAIVTMTTVGYGDLTPQTILGQILASFMMIFGYAIIVVPTGIFSVEFHQAKQKASIQQHCPACGCTEKDASALYCRQCGQKHKQKETES